VSGPTGRDKGQSRRRWRSNEGSDEDQLRTIADSLARVVGGIGPASDIMAVHTVWAELVGEGVADHCQPRRITDGCLFVEVDMPGWATEVRYLEATIVSRLQDQLPNAGILTMRVAVRR
jgi:predicted nucleic acid-binding Zn ribbon protein